MVDGVSYAVTTNRATFTNTSATDLAGSYTLLFPPNAVNTDRFAPRPQGHGWATVIVENSGAVKVVGKLADGATLSGGGALAKDGTVELVASLYKGFGVFAGKLTSAAPPCDPSAAVSDVTGTMTWTKPAEKKNTIFPRLFATTIDTLGFFYTTPASGERTFPGLNTNVDAQLKFLGGNLPADLTKAILISSSNAVIFPAPTSSADKLKLKFTAKTGAFSGTFLHTGTSKVTVFTGVVLEKQTRGAGYFPGTSDSGKVELTP